MGYRDRLQHGQWKGTRFYVREVSGTPGGMRVEVIEMAGLDGSKQQENGRGPGRYDLVAYFWGDDYDVSRDEFMELLCEGGAGTMTLPTYGDRCVRVVGDPIVSEHKDEGGYCTIRFGVVIEDRSAGTLRTKTDKPATVRKSAGGVRTAAANDFARAYDTTSMPTRYLRSTIAAISAVSEKMGAIQSRIQGSLAIVDNVSGAIFELDQTVNTLVSAPSMLVTKIVGVVGGVMSLGNTVVTGVNRTTGLPSVLRSAFENSSPARATLSGLKRIAGQGEGLVDTGSTTLSGREVRNTMAVNRLARAEALASSAEVYSRAAFDSSTLALEALEAFAAEVEDLSLYSASDELYFALVDLRASVTDHLTQVAGDLPQVTAYTPGQEIPALLIAYELYGDATKEAELVARNRLEHPLFVSTTIEVLRP